jgi:hypothetical protein
VQKHVLDHLRDYVAVNVLWEHGHPARIGYRGLEYIVTVGGRPQFYVEPRSGILRLAPDANKKQRRPLLKKAEADPLRRILSPERELRRIQFLWFEVEIARIPQDAQARESCYDVVEQTRLLPTLFQLERPNNPLWRTGRYAVRKRQLNSREIERYGLASVRSSRAARRAA